MKSTITVTQLNSRLDDITVIDVRSPGEYGRGHIPGVKNGEVPS